MSNETMNQGVPTFEPPKAEVPTFTPPTSTVPTFTPPAAPQFTPPARPAFTGPACHFHSDEPAVRRCAKCGKPICQDCVDNYQVTSTEYAGKPLCYDCCRQLVTENIEKLTQDKSKIKFHFILSIIGIAIGFFFGLSTGISAGDFGSGLVMGLVFAGVGGIFFSFLKFYLQCMWVGIKESFKALFNGGGVAAIIGVFIGLTIRIVWEAFKSIFITIKNTIDYIKYLKETEGFIESDTAALQQMADYMEYTLVRNKYEGVDIDTLLAQESSLADNSFARMVQEKGEDQAEAHIRGVAATINEHGEIIRNFAA